MRSTAVLLRPVGFFQDVPDVRIGQRIVARVEIRQVDEHVNRRPAWIGNQRFEPLEHGGMPEQPVDEPVDESRRFPLDERLRVQHAIQHHVEEGLFCRALGLRDRHSFQICRPQCCRYARDTTTAVTDCECSRARRATGAVGASIVATPSAMSAACSAARRKSSLTSRHQRLPGCAG